MSTDRSEADTLLAPPEASPPAPQALRGRTIQHYKILSVLGKGGMGEVYEAEDTRLKRKVALKFLPPQFVQDADRLRRFELEARATGSLNHPNILTIYDIGQDEGTPYIVAELLEGTELRAQLTGEPLPVRKALDYAQQIANGLAAAHEQNIVHRDLKPENLFVTKTGRVKILDFGLAKLRKREGEKERGGEADSTLSLHASISPSPATDPGTVMGTVGYMSPEQVRGEAVDHRSDIFSFGVILYEMLGGQRAFAGDTLVETMHAILKEEPPELSEANAKITPQLDKLVRRCLEKQPERRFYSAHDLGFALEAVATPQISGANRTEAVTISMATPRSGWRNRIWMLVAGLTTLLAVIAFGVAYFRRPVLEAEPMRFAINPPEKAKTFDWPSISPDGRMLAFIAEVDGKRQLWVRSLATTKSQPLVEVRDNFPEPFWSPDSQFIGYFEQRKLKKIALAGGAPETLCEAQNQVGGDWNRDGVILFGNGQSGIQRVSANGGAVTAVTTLDTARGDTFHASPTFLPDGRHFLFYILHADPAKRGIYLASLEGSETRRLLSVDAWIVKAVQHPGDQREGYLTFVRQGALMAQPFDFSRNELVGSPVRIAEHVPAPSGSLARYSLATNGTLVLLEKEAGEQLTWFDRAGKKLGTVGPIDQYASASLSPDGKRLAVVSPNPQLQTRDIYLYEGDVGTPFTFDPSNDQDAIWSQDGSRIVWASWREGMPNLFQKATNGTGQDELLLRSPYQHYPGTLSPDGRFLFFIEVNPKTSIDIWVLPMEGERKPWVWLNTPATEISPRLSPDGKWIAYQSNESGRNEIYVQAFVPGAPASGGKRQLSTNGGSHPHWPRDSRELTYVSTDNRLMVVDIALGAELKPGTPKELFSLNGIRTVTNSGSGYTQTADGQRFLFVTSADEASVPPFTVVLNWMAVMKK